MHTFLLCRDKLINVIVAIAISMQTLFLYVSENCLTSRCQTWLDYMTSQRKIGTFFLARLTYVECTAEPTRCALIIFPGNVGNEDSLREVYLN